MGSKPLRKSEVRRSITGSHTSNNGTHQNLVTTSDFNRRDSVSKAPKNSLTPLSRLKKFKKLRDRNLRKEVLGRGVVKQKLNMLESVEENHIVIKEKTVKGGSPMTSDEVKNGESLKNGLNGIEEEPEEVVSNGIENGHNEEETSPRRSSRNKGQPSPQEVKQQEAEEGSKEEKESSETEKEVDVETNKEEEEEGVEDERPVKIYRRSFRHSPRSVQPDRDPGPSTLDEAPSRYTPDPTGEEFPKLEYRISGRRSLRATSGGKRKAEEVEESPLKRMAFTPSVSSPGWRFLSSPFTRFWPKTPSGRQEVNDSMLVNVSTDSELSMADVDLTSEEIVDIETPTAEPPAPKSSWVCSVM